MVAELGPAQPQLVFIILLLFCLVALGLVWFVCFEFSWLGNLKSDFVDLANVLIKTNPVGYGLVGLIWV